MAAVDDIDLDDMDFEDDDMDFGFDDPFSEPPPPKDTREAVSRTINKVGSSFMDDFTDDKAETAAAFVKESIPSKISVEASNIINVGESFKKDILKSSSEVAEATKPMLKAIEGLVPKGGKIETLVNLAKEKLGMNDEHRTSEDVAADAAAMATSSVVNVLGEMQDRDTIRETITASIADKKTQSQIDLSAIQAGHLEAISNFNIDVTNSFYRKSLELQYRHLFTTTEQLDVTKQGFETFKNQLESIVANSALPDLVKTRNSEFMKHRLLERAGESLFARTGVFDSIKKRLSDEVQGVTSVLTSGITSLGDAADMVKSTSEMSAMAGGTEGMVGGLLAGGVRGLVGTKVGDILGKTKVGKKGIELVRNFNLDPSEALKDMADNRPDGVFKNILETLGDFTENKDAEASYSINKVDRDNVSVFDGRAHTSLTKIIPGLLSKILKEVSSSRTGKEEDELRYDYDTGTFKTTSSLKNEITEKIQNDLVSSGVNRNVEGIITTIVEETNLNVDDDEIAEIKQALLSYVIKGKRLLVNKLEEDGLYDELDPKLSKKFKKAITDFTETKDDDLNYKRVRHLNNELGYIKDRAPSPQELLNKYSDAGSIDLLKDAGIVELDSVTGEYKLDNASYKTHMTTAIKTAKDKDQEEEEEPKTIAEKLAEKYIKKKKKDEDSITQEEEEEAPINKGFINRAKGKISSFGGKIEQDIINTIDGKHDIGGKAKRFAKEANKYVTGKEDLSGYKFSTESNLKNNLAPQTKRRSLLGDFKTVKTELSEIHSVDDALNKARNIDNFKDTESKIKAINDLVSSSKDPKDFIEKIKETDDYKKLSTDIKNHIDKLESKVPTVKTEAKKFVEDRVSDLKDNSHYKNIVESDIVKDSKAKAKTLVKTVKDSKIVSDIKDSELANKVTTDITLLKDRVSKLTELTDLNNIVTELWTKASEHYDYLETLEDTKSNRAKKKELYRYIRFLENIRLDKLDPKDAKLKVSKATVKLGKILLTKTAETFTETSKDKVSKIITSSKDKIEEIKDIDVSKVKDIKVSDATQYAMDTVVTAKVKSKQLKDDFKKTELYKSAEDKYKTVESSISSKIDKTITVTKKAEILSEVDNVLLDNIIKVQKSNVDEVLKKERISKLNESRQKIKAADVSKLRPKDLTRLVSDSLSPLKDIITADIKTKALDAKDNISSKKDEFISKVQDKVPALKTTGNFSEQLTTAKTYTLDKVDTVKDTTTNILPAIPNPNSFSINDIKLKIVGFLDKSFKELEKVEDYLNKNPDEAKDNSDKVNKIRKNLATLRNTNPEDKETISTLTKTIKEDIESLVDKILPSEKLSKTYSAEDIEKERAKDRAKEKESTENSLLDIINSDDPLGTLKNKLKRAATSRIKSTATGAVKAAFNFIKRDAERGKRLRSYLKKKLFNKKKTGPGILHRSLNKVLNATGKVITTVGTTGANVVKADIDNGEKLRDKLKNLFNKKRNTETIKEDVPANRIDYKEEKKNGPGIVGSANKVNSAFDRDGSGHRDGSWLDRLKKKKDVLKNKNKTFLAKAKDSSFSWLPILLGAFSFIKPLLSKLVSGIKNLGSFIVKGIGKAFKSVGSFLLNGIKGIFGSLGKMLAGPLNAVKDVASKGLDKTKELASKAADKVKGIGAAVYNKAKTFGSKVINGMKNTKGGKLIANGIKTTKDAITSVGSKAISTLENSRVGKATTKLVGKAVEKVPTKSILNLLKSFKSTIFKKLGKRAGSKVAAKLAAKTAARVIPFAGTALLAYDAAKIGYDMFHNGTSLKSAISKQILGFDLFGDDAAKDEDGNLIKPDEKGVTKSSTGDHIDTERKESNKETAKVKDGDSIKPNEKRVKRSIVKRPPVKRSSTDDYIYAERREDDKEAARIERELANKKFTVKSRDVIVDKYGSTIRTRSKKELIVNPDVDSKGANGINKVGGSPVKMGGIKNKVLPMTPINNEKFKPVSKYDILNSLAIIQKQIEVDRGKLKKRVNTNGKMGMLNASSWVLGSIIDEVSKIPDGPNFTIKLNELDKDMIDVASSTLARYPKIDLKAIFKTGRVQKLPKPIIEKEEVKEKTSVFDKGLNLLNKAKNKITSFFGFNSDKKKEATKDIISNNKNKKVGTVAKIDKLPVNTGDLVSDLKRDEGVVLHTYKDSLGLKTIGTGHLVDKKGGIPLRKIIGEDKDKISMEENDYILQYDIGRVSKDLYSRLPWLKDKPDNVQKSLVNMAFNLGVDGLLKFKNTLKSIKNDEYTNASRGMLNSKWAGQVGNRATRLASIVASTEYDSNSTSKTGNKTDSSVASKPSMKLASKVKDVVSPSNNVTYNKAGTTTVRFNGKDLKLTKQQASVLSNFKANGKTQDALSLLSNISNGHKTDRLVSVDKDTNKQRISKTLAMNSDTNKVMSVESNKTLSAVAEHGATQTDELKALNTTMKTSLEIQKETLNVIREMVGHTGKIVEHNKDSAAEGGSGQKEHEHPNKAVPAIEKEVPQPGIFLEKRKYA